MDAQYCTFCLGDYLFGLDVAAVQEVMRHRELTPVPLAGATVGGLINLRGQIVTAIDLRERLGLPPAAKPAMNVVVRVGESLVSLMVDEIGDVMEIQQARYESAPATLSATIRAVVSGVYKLDDAVMLVMEPAKVVENLRAA